MDLEDDFISLNINRNISLDNLENEVNDHYTHDDGKKSIIPIQKSDDTSQGKDDDENETDLF